MKMNLIKEYRKSGIPAEVLIPAPVWTTTCWDSRIHLANNLLFSSTFSGESNFCK